MVGDILFTYDISGLPEDDDINIFNWSSLNLAPFNSSTTTVVKTRNTNTTDRLLKFNSTLKVTPDHRMIRKRDGLWKVCEASYILVGDIMKFNGVDTPISSIDTIFINTNVITLDVETADSYVASGFLVHNVNDRKN